ncbi:MAG: hypothetical protein ACRC1H_14055 [Caldilineaceae bacterium]
MPARIVAEAHPDFQSAAPPFQQDVCPNMRQCAGAGQLADPFH